MLVKKYKVKLTLLEPLLGTVPKSEKVFRDYLADKALKRKEAAAKIDPEAARALNEEEIDTLPTRDEEERGWTGFFTDEEGPFLYDYQVKGFIKEAGNVLKDFPDFDIPQLRDKVDNYVYVRPRRIRLAKVEPEPLERPLRAMTMQGPRVSLVRSDKVAAGTVLEFELWVLPFVLRGRKYGAGGREVFTQELLSNLYEFGEFKGLGQWRNGGWGSFTAEIAPL